MGRGGRLRSFITLSSISKSQADWPNEVFSEMFDLLPLLCVECWGGSVVDEDLRGLAPGEVESSIGSPDRMKVFDIVSFEGLPVSEIVDNVMNLTRGRSGNMFLFL